VCVWSMRVQTLISNWSITVCCEMVQLDGNGGKVDVALGLALMAAATVALIAGTSHKEQRDMV